MQNFEDLEIKMKSEKQEEKDSIIIIFASLVFLLITYISYSSVMRNELYLMGGFILVFSSLLFIYSKIKILKLKNKINKIEPLYKIQKNKDRDIVSELGKAIDSGKFYVDNNTFLEEKFLFTLKEVFLLFERKDLSFKISKINKNGVILKNDLLNSTELEIKNMILNSVSKRIENLGFEKKASHILQKDVYLKDNEE